MATIIRLGEDTACAHCGKVLHAGDVVAAYGPKAAREVYGIGCHERPTTTPPTTADKAVA